VRQASREFYAKADALGTVNGYMIRCNCGTRVKKEFGGDEQAVGTVLGIKLWGGCRDGCSMR
jgi:hypothetical protein